MEIRGLTTDDAEQAARLYLQSAEHHAKLDPSFYRIPKLDAVVSHYRELAERSNGRSLVCFVAEVDEAVVGMVEVKLSDPPSPHSMLRPRRIASIDVVVGANRRRRGVGTALMQRAEAWARDQGATNLMLDMLRANEAALASYRALGYEEHGAVLLKRHIESG